MFSRNHFSDLDEMLQSLVGWDLDFLPLERGKFPSRIGQYLFNDTFIGEANFFKKVEQRGATPPGYRTFVVPKNDRVNYHWRGREIDGQTLSLFPPNGELFSVSNGSFQVFTISFSFRILEEALEKVKSNKIKASIQGEQIWKVSHQKLHRIRDLIRRLISKSSEPGLFNSQEIEYELVSEILNSIDHSRSSALESWKRRDTALLKCVELIRSVNHNHNLTLSDLCRESKVSERTNQYAFKDRYGLTPKEYIKNYNLRMVRNKLKMSRKGARIQDVASEFGFWHMGQFASDYKHHFGELPSESLIRSK